MKGKYLHARLCVWIIRWFKSQVAHAKFFEELSEYAQQIAKSYAHVGQNAFDLMKLGQMCGVQSFISEHFID